jgi:DNA-directed RNA polymerase specialized sigma24 family protein
MADMTSNEAPSITRDEEVTLALERFGAEMYGLALTITASRPDAEDAYQSAWMDAVRHWTQLRDPSKRRPWLASIVARAALHARRRQSLWVNRTVPLSAAASLPAAMPWDPSIAKALARLTERQRAVVTLHYGHGYSLDETARLLRCRGGTARSHLSRAIVSLRRSLSDEQ